MVMFGNVFRHIAILSLALCATWEGAAWATHEGTAQETVTVEGVTVLQGIDLGRLTVCADCGYTVVDTPQFENVTQAQRHWSPDELVLAVTHQGVSKAYPLATLLPVRFHIVNDTFAGAPVAISFCPLCFSAVVFERPLVDGQLLSFATAGLYQRDLVMYDNVTFSLWQQFTGQPIAGPAVSRFGLLHRLPADIVPLGDWAAANPNAQVYLDPTLSAPQRSNAVVSELRVYERIASGTNASSRQTGQDTRLPDREIVVGITLGGQAKAYQESAVLSAGVLNDVVGEVPVLVVVDPVSSLIRFFLRQTANGTLTFAQVGGVLRDEQTHSVWSVQGLALSGALAGTQLEEIAGLPAYWFAWATFHPGTALYPS